MSEFCKCPRCGDFTFERLETYSHCVECLHFEDYWQGEDTDRVEAEQALREVEEQIAAMEREYDSAISSLFLDEESELVGA